MSKESKTNCTILCMAKHLNYKYSTVVALLGHDGTRGVHIQEIIDVMYGKGFVLLIIERKSLVEARGEVSEVYPSPQSDKRFSNYLKSYPCLLYLGDRDVPHMVLWDAIDGTSWDPFSNKYISGIPKQTTMAFCIIAMK